MWGDEWPDFAFTWLTGALDDLVHCIFVPCDLNTRLGPDR
jgi:hypothetical protein